VGRRISLGRAAQLSGLSKRSLLRAREIGALDAVRVLLPGSTRPQWLVDVDAFEAFLARCEAAAADIVPRLPHLPRQSASAAPATEAAAPTAETAVVVGSRVEVSAKEVKHRHGRGRPTD
jgi:hypothetical protein